MAIINIIVIIILFLLTGFLSGKNKDKLLFIKAFISAIFMIITSFVSIIISCIITYYLLAHLMHDGNSIFILGVVTLLLAGIINYHFIKLIIRLSYYNEMLIMILEYYIQWTTIFFTLYQFFTSSSETLEKLKHLQISTNTLDISFMNIIILPILLVSWISIAMTKIFIKDHKED
ncbi:SA1002 family membrane protein [Staphylococcus gallinarum]|uniref:SA1002 family membrane protein n=1 Tax=Staphylococcus gallinarum TaxID=1293 RepID=UPI00317ECC15